MTPELTSARESVRPDPEVVARATAADRARRRKAARRRIVRTAERAGIDPAYFLDGRSASETAGARSLP